MSDCRNALLAGSPTVHRDAPHNLLAEFDLGYGDVDEAFNRAPYVFTEQLWQHRGAGLSIECRGVVARYEAAEDRLTLWISTQTPHAAQRWSRLRRRNSGRTASPAAA